MTEITWDYFKWHMWDGDETYGGVVWNRKEEGARMKIYIVNESSVISDDHVEAWLPGFQRYTWHVRAYWPRTVTLEFNVDPPEDAWLILLLDDADVDNALGYHDYTAGGKPITKCFMKTDLDNGYNPTVTITHEIAEMMADPWCSETFQFSNTEFYAKEICDPCEADDQAYEINPEHGDTIKVSDFVTPAWFIPDHPGPIYDHAHLIHKPGEILEGGYMSVFNVDYGWTQYDHNGQMVPMDEKGAKSRPAKYARPR